MEAEAGDESDGGDDDDDRDESAEDFVDDSSTEVGVPAVEEAYSISASRPSHTGGHLDRVITIRGIQQFSMY